MKLFLILVISFLSLISFAQKDTMGLTFVKDHLYTDTLGNIYYKNLIPDDGPAGKFKIQFESAMPLTNWEKFDTLKNVIDLETYHKIKDIYAADKNHVYYFIYNSDGTTMRILQGADPSTFRHVKSDIGKDKNHVYKDACLVEGASPDGKIKIYPAEYSNAPYFTDGNKVFHNCKEIPDADVMSFKTILHEANFDAEDKNRKYLQGKPID